MFVQFMYQVEPGKKFFQGSELALEEGEPLEHHIGKVISLRVGEEDENFKVLGPPVQVRETIYSIPVEPVRSEVREIFLRASKFSELKWMKLD